MNKFVVMSARACKVNDKDGIVVSCSDGVDEVKYVLSSTGELIKADFDTIITEFTDDGCFNTTVPKF